jgi:CBS domain containing-hemolysin-like protein
LVCVVGGAYFAATESAFSAVNKIKVKTLSDDGNKRAKGVMYILNHFDKALTTLLVGNNVTKIAGASVFTILATDIFRSMGKSQDFLDSFAFSMICSALSTAIIFLFSEMIPKSFANDRSMTMSLTFQNSLRFLMKVLTPISALFNLISAKVSKICSSNKEQDPSITEDELSEIIETAEEEGVVDEEQGDMLKSALEFPKTTVADIMTMEKDVDFISINASSEEILQAIKETNYSRLPVKAVKSDRIIGIIRTKAYLAKYKKNPSLTLRSVMLPPYAVRDKAKIDAILTDMRQQKHHMAIVYDESKNFVGIVTIEDILEELVGEIFDEEDVVDNDFQALGGNKYLVNTHMLVGNALERMGIDEIYADIERKPIVAFILETLGHLPEEDESFVYKNLEITAKTMIEGRVSEVVIHILDEEIVAELDSAKAEVES